MGKKRIATKSGDSRGGNRGKSLKIPKKRLDTGFLYVISSYNNTMVSLTDLEGNLVCSSSSGALGFKGAKKGTPFAAAAVADVIGEKAKTMGVKNVNVIVKGVGSGRESAIRSFMSKGISLNTIKDTTPVPHNGPKPKKARRV